MATKEVCGGSLVATIRTTLPHVGFINLDTSSNGRRCFFTWRGFDFVASSKRTVKLMGFGRNKPDSACENDDSKLLQGRLREAIV